MSGPSNPSPSGPSNEPAATQPATTNTTSPVATTDAAAADTPQPKDSLKNLYYKTGDILKSNEPCIVHQCNCTSLGVAGLAETITNKFPYAAPYVHRRPHGNSRARCLPEDESTPGTIQVWRPPKGQEGPIFIGLYAQKQPGFAREDEEDSKDMREKWFKRGLELIEKVPGVTSLAFPSRIGCGLAGGDWRVYEEMIKEFAERRSDVSVSVYSFESGGAESGRGRGRGRGRGLLPNLRGFGSNRLRRDKGAI
jgi:O-acetyl-ADP-ribose deacetylase (regulator of RNase III)